MGKPCLLEPHFPLENRHHSGPRVGGFSTLPGSGEDPLNLSWRSSEASPLSSRAGYSHWFTFCPLMRETEAREGQGLPPGRRSPPNTSSGFLSPPAPSVATPTPESSSISHRKVSGKSSFSLWQPQDWPQPALLPRPGLSPSGADRVGRCTGLVPSLTQSPQEGTWTFSEMGGMGLHGWRWWRHEIWVWISF